ncbi:MAG: hypothetical protein RLZZ135_1287 [Cyanobacteriota bacterium]|jgi:hypothetical protein
MIRIPFDRCTIFTTLNFEQIIARLESAIYHPSNRSARDDEQESQSQHYYGQIRTFRFLATRIIGHKSAHLPLCWSPTIEGNIKALPQGYQISLSVNLQNLTFVLLLTCLGALFTEICAVCDRASMHIEDNGVKGLAISLLLYLAAICHLYFSSWQTIRFLQTLFAERLTGITKIGSAARPTRWIPDLPSVVPATRSATDCIGQNLPALSHLSKVDTLPSHDDGEMFTDNSHGLPSTPVIETEEKWLPQRTRSRSFSSGKFK